MRIAEGGNFDAPGQEKPYVTADAGEFDAPAQERSVLAISRAV